MAKLIEKKSSDGWYGDLEYWLISDRFDLTVDTGKVHCTFFISDKWCKINSLELIPKMGNDLGLFKDADITLTPGIDTCSISTSIKSRRDDIFERIENYLLRPENFASLEKKNDFY